VTTPISKECTRPILIGLVFAFKLYTVAHKKRNLDTLTTIKHLKREIIRRKGEINCHSELFIHFHELDATKQPPQTLINS
jgi:hypothetical protein